MTQDIQGANPNWYQTGYKICYYTGALGIIYKAVHYVMEKKYSKKSYFKNVLEVGAGNGEHFKFVKCNYDNYIMSDIDVSGLRSFANKSKIEVKKLDCTDMREIQNCTIDRLIATCLLVHVNNPFKALQEWRRVVTKGGNLTFYVALEPAFVLRVVRRLFIWPKSHKLGAHNPEILAYSEHKNHYPAMRAYIKEVFRSDTIKRARYPFFLPWNLSFFEIYHVTKNENYRIPPESG
jgi:ubiquinone/menaquinone biosynthesis C-methylase UbiE